MRKKFKYFQGLSSMRGNPVKWHKDKINHVADENCYILAEAAPEKLELRGLQSEFESASTSCSASSDARFSRPRSSSNALPVKGKHKQTSDTASHQLLCQLYYSLTLYRQ